MAFLDSQHSGKLNASGKAFGVPGILTNNNKHIFLLWAFSNSLICLIISVVSLVFWEITSIQKHSVAWSPIHDWAGVMVLMPVGWFFALFTPIGWLHIIGLTFALVKNSVRPLAISWLSSILFGLFWPFIFVIMMSA